MGDAKTSLTSDIQELISKSVEANKVFMNEGTRLMKEFTLSGKKQNITSLNTNFLSDAFNAYAKMNIQHMKNMLDLSVSLFKQAGAQTSDASTQTTTEETAAPSFTLTAETEAGSTAAYYLFCWITSSLKMQHVHLLIRLIIYKATKILLQTLIQFSNRNHSI